MSYSNSSGVVIYIIVMTVVHRILIVAILLALSYTAHAQSEFPQFYVLKHKVNLRKTPGTDASLVGQACQNQTLARLDQQAGWLKAAFPNTTVGWIRHDLVSDKILYIIKNSRQLALLEQGNPLLSVQISPVARPLGTGRYFGDISDKKLTISWPNRLDMRKLLENGELSYSDYEKAILNGPQAIGKEVNICSNAARSAECGAYIASSDFARLTELVPHGVRVEIYSDSDAQQRINELDFVSKQIFQGALEQLKAPAAGLAPGGRAPRLFYPGGDIQPDFATSADIVIRAVRKADIDLQAAIYEDILLTPKAYAGLDLGKTDFGAHRQVPVLHTFLTRHALVLPTDANEDPYSFEPGDIVTVSTGQFGEKIPDRAGIVGEEYNSQGQPLVITAWDLGQHTRRLDLLSQKDIEVTGHFRMTHLFDYQ